MAHTHKRKKNRAAIPEFHYFTVINTWLQTLTQNVSSEEKEKETLITKYTPWYMQDNIFLDMSLISQLV